MMSEAEGGGDVETRVQKLKRIIKYLMKLRLDLEEKMDAALEPTLALEEVRIINLIARHVDSYVYLYHREEYYEAFIVPTRRIMLESAANGEAQDKIVHEKEDPPVEDLDSVIGDVLNKLGDATASYKLAQILQDCKTYMIRPSTGTKVSHEEGQHGHMPCLKHRKQLYNILFDLEIMGKLRGYAPPSAGKEIQCYNHIRNWTASIIVHVEASKLLKMGNQNYLNMGNHEYRWNRSVGGHPLGDCFNIAPLGSKLALAMDLIPLARYLLLWCTYRLSLIFMPSVGRGNKDDHDTLYDWDGDYEEVDLGQPYLDNKICPAYPSSGTPDMMSRLCCLNMIVSKFKQIPPLPSGSVLTTMEARLYIQIVVHVNSAIWLSRNATSTVRKKGAGYQNVNVVSMKGTFHCSAAEAATAGDAKSTRMQYLLEIVSYLDAIKSVCLDAIPTPVELECYQLLSKLLDDNSISCLFPVEETDETLPAFPVSAKLLAWVRYALVDVYKSELKFFNEVNRQNASILEMLRQLIMCLEQGEANFPSVPSTDIFSWFEKNRVPIAKTLAVYFSQQPPEQLDRAIVTVLEMNFLHRAIFDRMRDATLSAEAEFCIKEAYELVCSEVNMALYITGIWN